MKKETPVRDLPRSGINPAILAERQGFDDWYFSNVIAVSDEHRQYNACYMSGYKQGEAQRKSAEKRSVKRK